MTYVKTLWVDDGPPPISAANLNKLEAGVEDVDGRVTVLEGSGGLPPGFISPGVNAVAPGGFLLCDGASYLRATYPALFTALGGAASQFGLPDGTHFNVPDLRGRVPVGLGTHTDVDALAENEGAALASRRPKHNHGSHAHVSGREIVSLTPGGTPYALVGNQATQDVNTSSVQVGPSTSPLDAPAYLVVNYFIKT